MKQEMMVWQWHQLNHMQIIYTSLQTDNYASTSSHNFLQTGCTSWQPAECQHWRQCFDYPCSTENVHEIL